MLSSAVVGDNVGDVVHICVFDSLLAVVQLTLRISASPAVQHGTTDMTCAMHP